MYLRKISKRNYVVVKDIMQQLSTIEKINEKTLPIQLHSFERNSFVFYVLWFYFDFIDMDYSSNDSLTVVERVTVILYDSILHTMINVLLKTYIRVY